MTRQILKHAALAALIWSLLGVMVGICIAPELTPIPLAANIIAGTIVLTPVGIALSLFRSKWQEVVIGSILGFTGGILLALTRSEPCGYMAAVGIIFGGMVGATAIPVLWRFPRLVFNRLAAK